MSSEWGPWIVHDGSGPPPLGTYVHVVYADNAEMEYVFRGERIAVYQLTVAPKVRYSGPWYLTSWDWSGTGSTVPVKKYRVRKPKGMSMLEDILNVIPEVKSKEMKSETTDT